MRFRIFCFVRRIALPSSLKKIQIDSQKMKEDIKMKNQSSKLLKLIVLSLFGTISMVLLFLNFPLPFLPPFLKIDFGEVPTLLAALIFSPMAGVVVQLIKHLLYLLLTGAGDPVGVFANFEIGRASCR